MLLGGVIALWVAVAFVAGIGVGLAIRYADKMEGHDDDRAHQSGSDVQGVQGGPGERIVPRARNSDW